MAIGSNVETTFWSTAGLHDGQEPFLEWISAISNDTSPPLINSVSYGDDEPTISKAYMEAVSTQFAAIGIRGVTLLFASGDSGVAGGDDCPDNVFVPSFPDTSPWVTSVGGTTPGNSGEVAW